MSKSKTRRPREGSDKPGDGGAWECGWRLKASGHHLAPVINEWDARLDRFFGLMLEQVTETNDFGNVEHQRAYWHITLELEHPDLPVQMMYEFHAHICERTGTNPVFRQFHTDPPNVTRLK